MAERAGMSLKDRIAAANRLAMTRIEAANPVWTDVRPAIDVLPGMALLGLGAGMAFNPVLLAAMSDVEQSESGLASGIVNTSFMMGGALGLAVLASIADARTEALQQAGGEAIAALNEGYRRAFLWGAALTALGALVTALLLRPKAGAEIGAIAAAP